MNQVPETEKLTIDKNAVDSKNLESPNLNNNQVQTQTPVIQNQNKNYQNLDDAEKNRLKEQKNIADAEIPYELDPTYKSRLLDALKKKGRKRLNTLFEPEFVDITKSEKEQKKMEEEEEKKLKRERSLQEEEDKKRAKELEEQENNLNFNSQTNQNSSKVFRTLDDDLAKFGPAIKAYIDQYYKISDMFVCCPLYYNYRISLQYEEKGDAYFLFDTKEYSPVCSHDCCPNQARTFDMELRSISIEEKFMRKRFAKLNKPYRCACSCLCACCSRPTLNVSIKGGTEFLGSIVEIRTLCTPTLYIYNKAKNWKYKISGSCSQCGYCCKDLCCGMCNNCVFEIYPAGDDPDAKALGVIKKVKMSGKKRKPDYEQVEVTFPINASCQDKCLILSSCIFIEMLYFQNISNKNRCHGNPID